MIIKRNHMEIELTPNELLAAYYEQQHLFDLSDVETFADMCDDNYKGQPYINDIRDPAVAEEVAKKYREVLDNNPSDSWFDDMSYAVMAVCRED